MPIHIWASLAVLAIAGCSSSGPTAAPSRGRVIVALTMDWEGAYLAPEGLDALDELRTKLGTPPLTHFVSAGYFTKATPDPQAGASIAQAVRKGDELAMHLHAWRSLAKASGLEPKLSPSFLTGTDKLLVFEDGDVGFDLDLDAYSVSDLRALLRTSRRLLEGTGVRVSRSFRAGGYLGTPKVLQAIRDESYTVDSSATDHQQLDEHKDEVLPRRIAAIWPGIGTTSQPFVIPGPGKPLLEMPIAAFTDYASPAEIVAVFEAAHARLAKEPTRDVYVVLGLHLETAADYGARLGEAIGTVRSRPELAEGLVFTTIEQAAVLARSTLATPAK